jgi:hypothetical protein
MERAYPTDDRRGLIILFRSLPRVVRETPLGVSLWYAQPRLLFSGTGLANVLSSREPALRIGAAETQDYNSRRLLSH